MEKQSKQILLTKWLKVFNNPINLAKFMKEIIDDCEASIRCGVTDIDQLKQSFTSVSQITIGQLINGDIDKIIGQHLDLFIHHLELFLEHSSQTLVDQWIQRVKDVLLIYNYGHKVSCYAGVLLCGSLFHPAAVIPVDKYTECLPTSIEAIALKMNLYKYQIDLQPYRTIYRGT